MNKRIMLAVAAAGIFFLIGNLSADEAVKQNPPEKKVQTECPVMGEKITNKSLFVDVQGKRIYVCCAECVEKVKAEPEKYIKAMEAKNIVLEVAPKEKVPAEKKDDAAKTEKK